MIPRVKPEGMLFGKPVATFSDHALGWYPAGTRSLSEPGEMLYISTVIVAEIRLDVGRMAELWTAHQRQRSAPLSARPMFERRVLPISEGNMLQWRLLIGEGREIMHTFLQPDPIIGATALEHGLTVVSKDASGYEKARVPAVDQRLAAAGL